ncbi:MAG TPA: HD domain-containing phosphohydrolase [Planctomycetota bacterium]
MTTSRILQSVDERTRGLVQRLQKLTEIGTQLSAERDLTKLLGLILRESRALTGADAGAVFVREDDVQVQDKATGKDPIHKVTPYLALKIAQNDSMQFPFKEMRLPFEGKTLSGHVALTGEVLNVPDAYQISKAAPYSYSTSFDEISGYRCKSMLVFPMKNREGDIIGVIQLINKKDAPAARLGQRAEVERHVVEFDGFDEELVNALASQAAVCVEKAKLYEDIEGMFEGLVNSFTLALERRNRTTYGHCMRVARYAVAIAEAINAAPAAEFGGARFSPLELKVLRYAALLHDIGKIAVPEAVLDKQHKLLDSEIREIAYRFSYAKFQGKPVQAMDVWMEAIRRINIPRGFTDADKKLLDAVRAEKFTDIDGQVRPLLTDAEYENLCVPRGNLTGKERQQIEQHIVDTWEILKRIPWPKEYRWVANIAACHHEKIDGSGYPWKLKGDEIPIGGQILAIVDIFEALTAKDRPYKPAIPVDKAIAIVQAEVDRGALNPKIWKLFLDRELHRIFSSETGMVKPPVEPVMPGVVPK